MSKYLSRNILSLAIVVVLLFLDQYSKYWIKTNLFYGEYISVFGHWFYIHFIENNGMAFGFEFGGAYGKLLLSTFRIIFCVFFGYILFFKAPKKNLPLDFMICLSCIYAGALGNTIDCIFYGVFFGYDGFLLGRVVDFLYFPLFEIQFPDSIPFIGGSTFSFFDPVFNISDSLITMGILYFLIFRKSLFNQLFETKTHSKEKENTDNTIPHFSEE